VLASMVLVAACSDSRTRNVTPDGAADLAATTAPEPEPSSGPPSGGTNEAESEPPAPEPAREVLPMAPDGTPMLPCEQGPAEMSCIPGGAFIRGTDDGPENARPRAEIWLQTFWIDRNEVTYEQYKACEAAKQCPKSGPQYLDFDRPKQPINGVNWFDARAYCEAQGKRLPTEAEWEKAARGTDGRTYPWGEDEPTCEIAIVKTDKDGRGCGLKKAGDKPETGRVWEVGSRPATQFGLHDMAGNSFEWVQDWYSGSYSECGAACEGVNPRGPCDGEDECATHKHKVVRGGSWYWGADKAMTYFRRAHVPRNEPFHHFGFRCAADLDQASRITMVRSAEQDLDEEIEK
jgi:sulfatase modifying factor 1